MSASSYDIGMVGLGVMGRNLLLNIADHGFSACGLDTDAAKVAALAREGQGKAVSGVTDAKTLMSKLQRPRAIILLVPAGKVVDAVLDELTPLAEPGDLIIDAGNSHFKDTDRRQEKMATHQLLFMGMGVSGGEAGARHGPSLMPGGPREAYDRVRPILEAVAAKVNGEPCVAYLGPKSAGHYVKMVHNGIEYGLMQLLAETYDLMRRGLGIPNQELHAIYERWNQGELNSFLVEITARIFTKIDEPTGKHLVDLILDVARQKGTGKWTSQDAMDLQSPIPAIDAAVGMRDLSAHESERAAAAKLLRGPSSVFQGDRNAVAEQVRRAYHFAMILTYAQGMALLGKASKAYGYQLNLAEVARVWRGGCIIRATQLEDIRAAYLRRPDLPNLLLDETLAGVLSDLHMDARATVRTAVGLGIAVPALAAALSYYDAYRCARLPTNLIQAQRDYFGAHTYERVDQKGTLHTDW